MPGHSWRSGVAAARPPCTAPALRRGRRGGFRRTNRYHGGVKGAILMPDPRANETFTGRRLTVRAPLRLATVSSRASAGDAGRLRGESHQAFRAFTTYVRLPPPRRIVDAARALGRVDSLLRRWSARWSWRERARRVDRHRFLMLQGDMTSARLDVLVTGKDAMVREVEAAARQLICRRCPFVADPTPQYTAHDALAWLRRQGRNKGEEQGWRRPRRS